MTDGGDGKDAGALRTIGEVTALTGIKSHVLRYWEDQFPMLRPLKRSGGRRYYRAEDVALVRRIDSLVNREGYTLKGARAVLKGGVRDAEVVEALAALDQAAPAAPDTASLLDRLRAIRADLAAALAA